MLEEETLREQEKLPEGPIGDQLAQLLKALDQEHGESPLLAKPYARLVFLLRVQPLTLSLRPFVCVSGFSPVIPPEVAAHVLAKVGCVSDNPSIPTLVSAATQQFAMKLLYEIKNQRELRAASSKPKLGRPSKRQKSHKAPPLTLPDVAEGLALLSSRLCGRQRPGTFTD